LTNAEKKQTFGSFRNAGYNAYHLAHQDENTKRIIQPSNPYRIKPFDDLWLKGWRDGEREHRMGQPFRHSPFSDDTRVLEDRRPKQKFVPRGKQKPQAKNIPASRPATGQKVPTNLKRLENRFNKKRTTV
jgi:hypothetical protein